MLEKSLYDLIRGLRNHKGNEKAFVQKTLKECRAEVRSQDMDIKATALLKLIYLEMVGHDMSWASFHVLEVMSSAKYHQKRVGYLGAIQSFRPDTEILILATNLLKKDLASASPTIISLPIVTLPHIITPSLALSTLSDLLPRLGHSHAKIRKKTLVTLYRLALVYPETLRAAWPKIKERLMDANEDPSVTAAIVNVVCELGWRRPHDFLPLAPRLFELLVDGRNNWMAIKLIKLFATLTPLEPRLVKKLLPPLTNIMSTTAAMSLLYECIHGIIQGGILGNTDGDSSADDVATLCVDKLRGMITINGDPNLKYVALLAFNKIVLTHPSLVARQEDAILECIDSPDITIRIQALELVQGMVTSENLVSLVTRLMQQLKSANPSKERQEPNPDFPGLSPTSDEEEINASPGSASNEKDVPLPEGYCIDVIKRVLHVCSQDNYRNIMDFGWYVETLKQLVRLAPVHRKSSGVSSIGSTDVSEQVGDQFRNVAVKVRAVRASVVAACESILHHLNSDTASGHTLASGALNSVAWVVGEYPEQLSSAESALDGLLLALSCTAHPEARSTVLLAAIKVFASIASADVESWTAERKSKMQLLIARIIHVLEPLSLHPSLENQERAVEFLELLKLTSEAASAQPTSLADGPQLEAPLLLTSALPSLFNGWELNSVGQGAQRNVPKPDGLDLDQPIHPNLPLLLSQADSISIESERPDEFEMYYNQRPAPSSLSSSGPAIDRLGDPKEVSDSYQQWDGDAPDADTVASRKKARLVRNKDDPFYISNDENTRSSTPIHSILQNSNGPDVDIDSIPIMQLDLENVVNAPSPAARPQTKPRHHVSVAADEMLEDAEGARESYKKTGHLSATGRKSKQSLLQVNSSTIAGLSLEGSAAPESLDFERRQHEEAEMQQAIKEVERLHLEMQRANERVQVAQGVDVEGTVVAKKARKKKVDMSSIARADAARAVNEPHQLTQGKKAKVKKKIPSIKADEGVAEPSLSVLPADDGIVVPKAAKRKKKNKATTAETVGTTAGPS